ncbi:hypothetical protein ACQ4PT_055728 [Festuca glaucescens]
MDMVDKEKNVVEVGDGWNQHGFPRGYHFVPKDIELIGFLEETQAGRALPRPLPNIFHDVRIRDYHPAELYEKYKEDVEAGSIYFFDRRETGAGGKLKKPVRTAKGGGWKASGGGKALTSKKRGGVVVGHRLTLVFYEYINKDPRDKTDWAIKEYTTIGTDDKVADLALYRLYKMKKGNRGEKNAGQGVATSPKMKKRKGKKNAGTPKVEELPSPAPTSPQQKVVNHSELVDWDNMAVVAHDLPTSQQQAAEHLGYPETDEQPLKMLPPSPLPAATDAEGYLADEFTEWCETKQQQQQEAASPWFPRPGEDFMLTDLPMLTEADDIFTRTFAELLDGIQDEQSPDEQVYSCSNQQHQ